jgi:two-component system OmpR family response regulator
MNTTQDHVLVVDDDPEIRRLLQAYLEKNGLRVTTVGDGDGMWSALERSHVDLVVLDIMLPRTDGLELCRTLRARSRLPVIMLTARGDEMDRILGLEMGADDYLPKPFSARELLARIKVVLRRTRELPQTDVDETPEQFAFAGWTLDTRTRSLISPDGVLVALSHAEYQLLLVLVTHANRVLTRDQLLDLTRGREAGPFDRSVDVLVGRLRRRLGDDAKEPQLIKTVRGQGYLFAGKVARGNWTS